MAEANWGNLGAGASGQPEHLPIPTDEDGHGPVPDEQAMGYSCRCGSRACLLDKALKDAWRSGIRLAATAWAVPAPPSAETLAPDQVHRLFAAAGAGRSE